MHDTAYLWATWFAKRYCKPGMTVVDFGGRNVNGSPRIVFEQMGCKFICVDMDEHPSVDIVVKVDEKLPFEDGSIDRVISTSCFEHDPMFWLTFREIARVLKKDGYFYLNVPSNGKYHEHPGDNWRFYKDSASSLAVWSCKTFDGVAYPMKVVESFHAPKMHDEWIDYVAVFQRTDELTTDIINHNYTPMEHIQYAQCDIDALRVMFNW